MEKTPESDGAASVGGPLRPAGTPDRSAFSYWCDLTEKEVFAVIWRRVRNDHTALELSQEVYLKAWRKWHQFNPSIGDFRAWITKIAVNTAKSHHRAQNAKKRPKTFSLFSETTGDGGGAEYAIPEPKAPNGPESVVDKVVAAEAAIATREEVEKLSAPDRELLRLYYHEQKSYAEISALTGRSESAIGAALTRAREKLSQTLRRHDPGQP